jgi:hypothetical protein
MSSLVTTLSASSLSLPETGTLERASLTLSSAFFSLDDAAILTSLSVSRLISFSLYPL